jgi:hypothetical protein
MTSMTPESSELPGAAPRSPQALAMAVHSLPAPQLDESARRVGRVKMLLVLAACAAPVIASYFTYFVLRPQGRTNNAVLIEPAREWPAALELRDAQGRGVTPSSLRHQWLLVALVDGPCAAACERRLYAQRQLREMLGRERTRLDKIVLVVGSTLLEPKIDAALRAEPTATILHAPREALRSVIGDAADATQQLYIVDPMGAWMMRVPDDLEPAKVKRDLDRLMRASSSWDRAGR